LTDHLSNSLSPTSPSLCPISPPRTPSQSIRPTRSVMVVLITNTLVPCISCALLGTPHSCLHTRCFWFIPRSSRLHSSFARCDDCHHHSHLCASSVLRSGTPYTCPHTPLHRWLFPHGVHTRTRHLQEATTVAAVDNADTRLRELVTDTDDLLCSVPDFTMGWWIDAARRIAPNDTVQRDALEWAARAQPSACPRFRVMLCFSLSPLSLS